MAGAGDAGGEYLSCRHRGVGRSQAQGYEGGIALTRTPAATAPVGLPIHVLQAKHQASGRGQRGSCQQQVKAVAEAGAPG